MSTHTNDRAFWLRIAVAACVASLSSGCGYLMQARDHAEPVAVSAVIESQTLNPEAGRNQKVVAGLSGDAAQNVNDAYANSFGASEATEGFQGVEGLSVD